MWFIIYCVISIIVGYVTYKVQEENFEKELQSQYMWVDCKAFWIIFLFTVLWIAALPAAFIIWVLNKTLGKIIDQIKNKNK